MAESPNMEDVNMNENISALANHCVKLQELSPAVSKKLAVNNEVSNLNLNFNEILEHTQFVGENVSPSNGTLGINSPSGYHLKPVALPKDSSNERVFADKSSSDSVADPSTCLNRLAVGNSSLKDMKELVNNSASVPEAENGLLLASADDSWFTCQMKETISIFSKMDIDEENGCSSSFVENLSQSDSVSQAEDNATLVTENNELKNVETLPEFRESSSESNTLHANSNGATIFHDTLPVTDDLMKSVENKNSFDGSPMLLDTFKEAFASAGISPVTPVISTKNLEEDNLSSEFQDSSCHNLSVTQNKSLVENEECLIDQDSNKDTEFISEDALIGAEQLPIPSISVLSSSLTVQESGSAVGAAMETAPNDTSIKSVEPSELFEATSSTKEDTPNNPFDACGEALSGTDFSLDDCFGSVSLQDSLGNEADCKRFPDFNFKVPSAPSRDNPEEDFTDAVEFFKDPSSMHILESYKSNASESDLPRSSLYVKFDPLHEVCATQVPKQYDPTIKSASPSATEKKLETCASSVLNNPLVSASIRESIGNILMSFDSPKKTRSSEAEGKVPAPCKTPPKLYTEDELQQQLKIYELSMQDIILKKQREFEEDLTRKENENNEELAKHRLLVEMLKSVLEELQGVVAKLAEERDRAVEKAQALEVENKKLNEDLKTATEDLQSVETTFADFHKRYEQSKGMLKAYRDNEEYLKKEFWDLKNQLKDQEEKYLILQGKSEEDRENLNAKMLSSSKGSDLQLAVLKAQLKKNEIKTQSQESDIIQLKKENMELKQLCDDLMAKVGAS